MVQFFESVNVHGIEDLELWGEMCERHDSVEYGAYVVPQCQRELFVASPLQIEVDDKVNVFRSPFPLERFLISYNEIVCLAVFLLSFVD